MHARAQGRKAKPHWISGRASEFGAFRRFNLLGFAMEKIVGKGLARGIIFPDFKFALGQTDAHAFTSLIEDEKSHQFFPDFISRLAIDFNAFFADCAAAVDDDESARGQSAFPDFCNFEFDPRVDPPLRIFQAGFACDGAVKHEVSTLA